MLPYGADRYMSRRVVPLNACTKYFIKFQHIQIRIPDEADVPASVAHYDRPLAYVDVLLREPRD